MKKFFTTMFALALSLLTLAGNFVMLPYSGRAELEKHFSDPNLTVHFYTDSEVFATAERFDAGNMVMIDDNAFSDNGCYTLVYCPKAQQRQFDALLSTQDYVIVKGAAMPYKNDGAVAIFNKKASLPKLTRDFPVVTEEDPRIREMLNQVNMDSLEATVQHLQDYGSRIWNSDNAFAASDWIASRMEALGLEVEQQPFNANTWMGSGAAAPNVIGIQRGTLYPDTYVVCGSHFDSFSYEAMMGGGTAPGADDNATGVASVLESARIMTQYEFEYSIIYCAYGCEEMGLYGSEAYASRCQQQGMDIIGYFNNDMNGYLYGDQIHIDCIYPNSVEPIGTYYMNVGEVYYPELPIRHVNFTQGDSDHTSFNNHGYMGIYPFEDYEHYSPYIHTPNDVIGTSVTSFEMGQQYCQMNIACLAEIANPIGDTPVVECNPVREFSIELPVWKDTSPLWLHWKSPEEGSTGNLERFDVYRDNVVIGAVDWADSTYVGYWGYEYMDTITVGAEAEYFIMAVYSDGCEAPSQTEIGYGISAVEESESNVMVYPNPSNGTFNLNLGEGQWDVEVYDITGRKVYENRMDGRSVLDLGKCRKGVYFLKAMGDSRGVTAKVMVQ
ncbi:MAG: M28 family peptidase [Bacteroidales bacterium]|nr:M28 family peptidase [Bacteroidales bacterium]